MKFIFGRTALWLWLTAALSVAAFAAAQDVVLPEGEGKKILETSCTACHGLAGLNKYKDSYGSKEWKDLVQNMVGYGADVKEPQVNTLVDYLAKNFGPQGGGAKPPADANAGKKILETACTTCHGLDGVQRQQLSRDGWENVVRNMIGYGATVPDDQVPVLSDYLFKNYGPK